VRCGSASRRLRSASTLRALMGRAREGTVRCGAKGLLRLP